MVAAGSQLTFDVSGTAGGWVPTTQDGLHDALITELAKAFTVISVVVTPGGSWYELQEWPFRATVIVETVEDHAALADVGSMVVHAFYDATGHMATAGVQGSQDDPRTTPGKSAVDTILDPFKALLSGLQQETNTVLIILGVVVVAGFYYIGGKSTRVRVGL